MSPTLNILFISVQMSLNNAFMNISEVEKRISHRETSYALSPRMLRKITYGSLQNIVRTQEQERKGVVEVIDLTGDSDSVRFLSLVLLVS